MTTLKTRPGKAMYAELHCKTNFSFLQGASHPDELVQRAVELGYHALAVTDVNSLAGVVRAHAAAKGSGLKLVVGAEITPVDAPAVVLWAPDRAAYGRLCRLITRGRRRATKGECVLTLQDVAEHADGLLAGVLVRPWEDDVPWPRLTEMQNPVSERPNHVAESLRDSNPVSERPGYVVQAVLDRYRQIFSGRCYLIAEFHRGPDDLRRLEWLQQLSRAAELPLVAAGDVYYHIPARQPLQHVLTAIRHGVTVARGRIGRLFPNAQRHLKSLLEICANCSPGFLTRSQRTLRDRRPLYVFAGRTALRVPARAGPAGLDADRVPQAADVGRCPAAVSRRGLGQGPGAAAARTATDRRAALRGLFPDGLGSGPLRPRAEILCQGRGSAANSAVCYCLEHHRRRSGPHRSAVRTVHQQRTQRSAGHRRGFRAPAAGGSAAVLVSEIRPRAGRHRRHRDHLPHPFGDPRGRQGLGCRWTASTPGQEHGRLSPAGRPVGAALPRDGHRHRFGNRPAIDLSDSRN
jgi:error-prone DNA polymerase